MLGMCQLSGWQATTLNPDMGDAEKLAIVSARFGKLATEDDYAAKYTELISLSAVTMGWAQGIARREARERKRRSREAEADPGGAQAANVRRRGDHGIMATLEVISEDILDPALFFAIYLGIVGVVFAMGEPKTHRETRAASPSILRGHPGGVHDRMDSGAISRVGRITG